MEDCTTADKTAITRVWIGLVMGGAGTWGLSLIHKFFCPDRKLQKIAPAPEERDDPPDSSPPKKPNAKPSATTAEESATRQSNMEAAPDLIAARQHLVESSNTDVSLRWRPIWSTDVKDIGTIGGAGLELYFRALKTMGYCFLYMTLVTSPLLVFSTSGTFSAAKGGLDVSAFSIGNLGDRPTSGRSVALRDIVVRCQSQALSQLTPAFGGFDMISVLIFLWFVWRFRYIILPRIEKESDLRNVTPADYSVQIDGLPKNIDSSYESELHTYLEERLREHAKDYLKDHGDGRENLECQIPEGSGEVCEISLVRDFGGCLFTCLSYVELQKNLEVLNAKGDAKRIAKEEYKAKKLQIDLDKYQQHGNLKSHEDCQVLRAYAILNTTFDVKVLRHAFRLSRYRVFRNSCCQRREKQFRGRWISVRSAPEPTNILWENTDLRFCNRLMRKMATAVLCLLLMCISFLILDGSNRMKREILKARSEQNCDEVWQEAQAISADQAASKGMLDCYCAEKGYHKVLSDRDLALSCKDWLSQQANTLAVGAFSGLAVVVLNVVLRASLVKLAIWERPPSVVALQKSIMIKVFVAQFINTALVTLLSNASFLFFAGDYDDFSRNWYAAVGASLIMTMAANVFASNFLMLFYMSLNACRRRCCASKVKHQRELLAMFTNPEFNFSARFAQLLTTVYCTMLYSSGLPILLPFALVFTVVAYWCDKLVLLRGSRRPPVYDCKVPKMASELMIFAGLLHCIFAMAMFGQVDVFPSNPIGGSLAATANSAVDDTSAARFQERALREATWPLLIVTILLVAFYVVRFVIIQILGSTVAAFLRALEDTCPCRCRRRDKVQDLKNLNVEQNLKNEADGATWWESVDEISKLHPPASYILDNNPKYSPLANFLKTGIVSPMSVVLDAQVDDSLDASSRARTEEDGNTEVGLSPIRPSKLDFDDSPCQPRTDD